MAQAADFAFYRGENATMHFTMAPVTNITGWTIVFALKKAMSDSTPIVTVPAVIVNGVNGVFTVSVPHTQTNRTPGGYVYDVQRTDSGSETMLWIGLFQIKPEVTY